MAESSRQHASDGSTSRRRLLALAGVGAAAAIVGSGAEAPPADAALTTFTDAVDIRGSNPSDVQLIVRGASRQAVHLFEVQDSTATNLFSIDEAGAITITGRSRSSVQLVVRGVAQQSADLVDVRDSGDTNLVRIDNAGHVGINSGGHVLSAQLWIGTGAAGTLTERIGSGIEVKIDTTTSGQQPDGIRCNVAIVPGTPSTGVRGVLAQLDVDGSIPSGKSDCVALWGETFVNSASEETSYRDTWGLNTDVEINLLSDGHINPYNGAAVGAEIGCHNSGGTANDGGSLTIVSQGIAPTGGSNAVQFGALITSGTGSLSQASTQQNQIRTNILMPSNYGRAPAQLAIYYGIVAGGNVPDYDVDSPPLFMVDNNGATFVGSFGAANTLPSASVSHQIGVLPIFTDPGDPATVAGYIPIYQNHA